MKANHPWMRSVSDKLKLKQARYIRDRRTEKRRRDADMQEPIYVEADKERKHYHYELRKEKINEDHNLAE